MRQQPVRKGKGRGHEAQEHEHRQGGRTAEEEVGAAWGLSWEPKDPAAAANNFSNGMRRLCCEK